MSNNVSNDTTQSQNVGHIALAMLPNTRDLGYLTLASGKRILPRRLIRSGALAEATQEDLRVLTDEYQVQTVIDLRTSDEQSQSPDPADRMPDTQFIDAPILGFSTTGITRENGLVGMVRSLSGLKHDPKKLMRGLYKDMLLDETGIKGYTKFFEILLDAGDGAVLWHCSAGKDRAGLATALLLTALGASREEIVPDYLATNQFLEGRADKLKELFPAKLLTKSVLSSLQVLNSADETFLAAGFAGVESEYGSLDAYLAKALLVDDEAKEALRQKYLAPLPD